MTPSPGPSLDEVLGAGAGVDLGATRLVGGHIEGRLPLTADQLRNDPSGHLFGLTQNVGMGWAPERSGDPQYLVLSTQGGLRAPDGSPLALGYHTGHWEVGLLVARAAETLRAHGAIPFAAAVTDPCDGRTQGTTGMFDSLPYRNDAAMVLRRLARSLPQRRGVLGIATCDKGLPAMMQAVAGLPDRPAVVVPGGVTLPPPHGEDAGAVQTIGVRFAHGLLSLDDAAALGCRACGSPGGGCQFLGTAATAQVVAEALGLALAHTALAPSGEPVWLDGAHRSALALLALAEAGTTTADVLTDAAVRNALVVHAAFGGSTNLLLHVPAIAAAAGLAVPTVDDWRAASRATPRLVDALPNGPRQHPTVQVFMAGGVPEVQLHLRRLGVLDTSVRTVAGITLDEQLDRWEASDRRREVRARLAAHGVDPDVVILAPDAARAAGMTGTIAFPGGNLAPGGALVKATAIDPAVVDADGVYRHTGPARVFTRETDAVAAIKGLGEGEPVRAGDVLVLAGIGPAGTGMEEIYQVTSALKMVPFGKHVTVVTDGRFSGVSTGACIGHVAPEALAGGPIGRLRDGDVVRVEIDRVTLTGTVELAGADGRPLTPAEADAVLASRPPHPGLAEADELPADTRLWAALVRASGGTWAGCTYDVDRIVAALDAAGRA